MKYKRKLAILACGALSLIWASKSSYADELDDSIEQLEAILKVTQSKYENFVLKNYESVIRSHVLQRNVDITNITHHLLEGLTHSKIRADQVRSNWNDTISDLPFASSSTILEKAFDLTLMKSEFENEYNEIGKIRTDLETLKTIVKEECSSQSIQNLSKRNSPLNQYVVYHPFIVPSPEVNAEIQFHIGNTASTTSPLNTSGMIATVGTAVAASCGAGALLSAAIGGGAGVAFAVASLAISSKNTCDKENRQWDLVEEIIATQKEAIQKTTDRSVSLASKVCHDYKIEEFNDEINSAIELSYRHLQEMRGFQAEFDDQWTNIKRRYSEIIAELERDYFPNLAIYSLTLINSGFDFVRQTLNPQINQFIRSKIAPLAAELQTHSVRKLEIQHKMWEQVIIGDSRFSHPFGSWKSLKKTILQRIFQ